MYLVDRRCLMDAWLLSFFFCFSFSFSKITKSPVLPKGVSEVPGGEEPGERRPQEWTQFPSPSQGFPSART